MRALIAILCFGLLTGCVTRAKTYRAPDDAKVRAATVDLNVKVDRARDTAKKAKTDTEESAASAKRLIALAKTTRDKIDILRQKLPPEYLPLADDVRIAADEQSGEEETGRVRINSAIAWNLQLETQLLDAEKARQTLQAAQDQYAGGAAQLAADATTERTYRIKAERQLLQQKIWGLLWKLGGGLVVVIIIVLIFLWITGRFAIKLVK